MSDLDLLVIGDANPDIILSGGDLEPRYGQAKTAIRQAGLVVGGSAAIVAMGAARLGMSVGICGVVGDDAAGRLIREELTGAGVQTDCLRTEPTLPTGISVIFVRDDDRAIMTASGTISALSPKGLDRLPDSPARHVHVGGFYLMSETFRSALPGAFARFRAAGVTTSIDTGWDPDDEWMLDDVFRHLDLFLP
ncbi:MAG: carbohydrate kinase family protein, partial [Actinomycetota bacterium]